MNTPAKKRVARKRTDGPAAPSRKAVRPAEPPEAPASDPAEPGRPASKNLLTAGIKALTSAHEEAVARQSRVFESLLGLGQSLVPKRDDEAREARAEKPANPLAAAALDPFGFRKFEDVFDQRVARTLQRLEVPAAETLARLEAEVASLRDEVARLRNQLAKR